MAAVSLARICRANRSLRTYVAATLGLAALEVAVAFPHYLGHTNVIAHSLAPQDYYMVDSSIDWGHDLIRLSQWQENHAFADPFYFALFSGYPPELVGVKGTPIPVGDMSSVVSQESTIGSSISRPGWYAISRSTMRGRQTKVWQLNGRSDIIKGPAKLPGEFEFIDYIGTSIVIYRLQEHDRNVTMKANAEGGEGTPEVDAKNLSLK